MQTTADRKLPKPHIRRSAGYWVAKGGGVTTRALRPSDACTMWHNNMATLGRMERTFWLKEQSRIDVMFPKSPEGDSEVIVWKPGAWPLKLLGWRP